MGATLVSSSAAQFTWLMARALSMNGSLDQLVTHGQLPVGGLAEKVGRSRLADHHFFVGPREELVVPSLTSAIVSNIAARTLRRPTVVGVSFARSLTRWQPLADTTVMWSSGHSGGQFRRVGGPQVVYVPHPLRAYEDERLRTALDAYPAWGPTDTPPGWFDSLKAEEIDYVGNCVVASAVTRRSILESHPDARVETIPYPAPSSPLRPWKARSGLDVLFLGALNLRKGAPVVLEVARRMAVDRSVRFHLVGNVPDPSRLDGLPPNVLVHGRVAAERKRELIEHCDVALLPSFLEGFGHSLLEGYASGLTSISTSETASVDLLEPRMHHVVAPNDVDAIVSVLADADRQVLYEMGREARETVSSRSSMPDYGTELAGALRTLVDSQ